MNVDDRRKWGRYILGLVDKAMDAPKGMVLQPVPPHKTRDEVLRHVLREEKGRTRAVGFGVSVLLILSFLSLAVASPGGASLGASPPVDIQESFLLEQIHRHWAKRMGNVIGNWWSWCGSVDRVDSSRWASAKEITVYSSNHPTKFVFSQLGYDPTLSAIHYGKPSVVTTEVPLPSHDYIYDLSGELGDGEFRQTDSVTLGRSRSVSITQGVEFDVTASTETKVSGEYAGVGLEQTISLSLGYKNSREESRASDESKSTTVEHEFNVPLPAGETTRISLHAGNSTSSTPMSIDGVAAWEATITLGEPCADDPHWFNEAGSWVIYPDNETIWACWGDTPYPGSSEKTGWQSSGAPAAVIHDWLTTILSKPCPFTIGVDTATALFDGQVAEWQGLNGERRGLSGSWLSRQPQSVGRQLDQAQDPANRSVAISGRQSLQFQSDIITKVSQIDPGDVESLIEAGAQLCATGSEVCE